MVVSEHGCEQASGRWWYPNRAVCGPMGDGVVRTGLCAGQWEMVMSEHGCVRANGRWLPLNMAASRPSVESGC
jgi:hypothetical protein